jgi:F-type H+-transporting ATPase subunit epsilon
MADTITLSFTVPRADLAERDVDEVVLPGTDGIFDVFPGHDALMSTLDVGVISVRAGDRVDHFFCAGGYFEIHDDRLIILAEVAEPSEGIDVERAKAAEQRARDRIQRAAHDDTIDAARAEYALKKALVRQEASKR